MKCFTPTPLLACALSVQAAVVPHHKQEVLADVTTQTAKVPGHNNAYFTQVESRNQLFGVRELVVYPNPPKLNEHIFLYLDGWITEPLPGLSDATLSISGACPEYWEQEAVKITDWPRLVVRRDFEYGGPLKSLENNELMLDWKNIWWGDKPEEWNCSVEATAKLPDERILFSFAQNFTLQWPPN